jgi:hypothetical protein
MKDINDLINGIKGQDELMSLDEVKTLIAKPATGAAQWVKPTILSLVGVAILSVGIFFFTKNKTVTKSMDENGNRVVTTRANDKSIIIFDSASFDSSNKYKPFRRVENYLGRTATSETPKETTSNSTQATPSQLENSSEKPTTYRRSSNDAYTIQTPPVEQTTIPLKNTLSEPRLAVHPTSNGPKSESYYYDAWSKELQTFTVSLDKPNVIKGEEGTIIIIPKGAICGTYESYSGEVHLTEYYKKEDMLLAQLSTGSGHNMLESAGMITLTAASDGKELKLCKDVTVLFPSDKYLDSSYIGFTGNWDDQHNVIDWTPNGGANVNFFGGALTPNCTRPTYEAIRCNWPTRKAEFRKWGKSDLRKDLRNDEVVKRIRRRFWFQDSITSVLYDEVYEGIKHKMKDTLSARAYHACRVKQAKAAKIQAMLDSMRGEFGFDPYIVSQKMGYILANVSGFGSINCDRFTQYKKTRDHTYKVGGSEGVLSARLMFHDIKSILPGSQTATDEVTFTRIPDGLNATLLVIKYVDSSIQIAHQAMETGANPDLQFETIVKDELPDKLKAITAAIGNPKTEILERDYSAVLADDDVLSKAMSLTKEELEKFHIYQHDDILLFSRSRGDQEALELIFRKGITSHSSSSTQATPLKLISDEYPKAVVTIQTTLYKKWNTQWDEINCAKYMPILVNYDHGIADYSVWWFENNDKNIAKLPERYQETYTQYCLQPKEVSSDSTYKKGNKQYVRKPKSHLDIPYSKDQLILADEELANALKIEFNSKSLIYTKRKGPFRKKQYKYKSEENARYSYITGLLDYNDDYQKNTPPSYITFHDSNYLDITEMVSSNNSKLDHTQYFYAHKHQMIAVSIGKIDKKEVIFWYEDTQRLNELISEEDKTRTTEYLTTAKGLEMPIPEAKEQKRQLHLDQMQQFKALRSLSINPVRLTPIELAKLDISQKDGDIYYTQYSKDYAYNFKFTKRFTITDFEKLNDDSKSRSFKPSFVSDKYGKSYRMRTVSDSIDLDKLIPIYVGSEKEYRLSDYFNDFFHPDCIFWYEPTEEFLAALPQDIRKQLSYELALISDATQTPSQLTTENPYDSTPEIESCVYLDPCADIKTNITDMVLFPNPTKGIVNVSISLSKSVGGDIKVTNLTGQPFLEKRLEDCSVQSTLDVSHLPAGLYLVTLLSDDGDKITRRVIRE